MCWFQIWYSFMAQITLKPQTPPHHPRGKCWEPGVLGGGLDTTFTQYFSPQYTKLVILCTVLSTNYTTCDYLLSNHMRISAHITNPTTVGLTRPFCLQTANPGYMKSYECCQGLENMTSYWFKKRVLPSRSSVLYWLSWRGCFFSFPAQPEGLRCTSNVILEKKSIKALIKKRVPLSHTSVSYWLPRGGCFSYSEHSPKGCAVRLRWPQT